MMWLKKTEVPASLFFDPSKRNSWKGFHTSGRKAKITEKGKSKDITVHRDTIRCLSSCQEQSSVDIDKALTLPLAPVPLLLSTPDGIRWKTAKSTLFEAAIRSTDADPEIPPDANCYVVALAALLRSV